MLKIDKYSQYTTIKIIICAHVKHLLNNNKA